MSDIVEEFADIYLFNPTCEYAVASGNASWQPNRLLQKMEADLEVLPIFLARSKDYVLVEKRPSENYLALLKNCGIEVPHFMERKTLHAASSSIQKYSKLKPWGWSPAAHKLLQPLKVHCSEAFQNSPVFNWQQEYRNYYSKEFSRDILLKLLSEFPDEDYILTSNTGQVCSSKFDFEKALLKWGKIMVKAPWSSSGRGLQAVTKTPVHEKVWEKLLGIVKEQGFAMVEPHLDKQLDIAFQFEVEKGNISYLGISNFIADKKGQYQGNHLNGLPNGLDEDLREFVKKVSKKIIAALHKVLSVSELAKIYEGNFGVDALIFKDSAGSLKINPCLEINVRQNMGLLSLQLEKLLLPYSKGIFRTWYQPGSNFMDFSREMQDAHPLQLQNGKIKAGYLPLTEPATEKLFGAYLLL
ncbi:hypothetical protein [Maribellus sediminis]|uniref:hypothetical protein n=1 Tax=Maribellus sediminis TaxID=2696285 RepID=UPI00143202AB|nr:hypothetical protein [Maribellus sediminis]